MNATTEIALGHNAVDVEIHAEVRLFNSLSRYAEQGLSYKLTLPAGSDISTILRTLKVPRDEVRLIFVNGRDISPRLGTVRTGYEIENGDIVALSGPVPYSWGYGAPIV